MFLLVVASAWACKSAGVNELRGAYPQDGEVGVPLDAGVLLLGLVGSFEVYDAEGGVVATTEANWSDGTFDARHLQPVADLSPEATYTVARRDEAFTFQTGAAYAAEVEGAPGLQVLDVEMGAWRSWDCFPPRLLWLKVQPDEEDAPAWWEVEITDVELGWVAVVTTTDEAFEVGHGRDGNWNYDLEPSRDLELRARGLNAAGVPGPWSDPVAVRTPCACAPTGGSAPLFAVGAALAAVLRRRDDNVRRRSPARASGA